MKNLLALALALLFASCSALGLGGGTVGDPTPDLVRASRAAHDVIAPRWAAYVAADPTLSPLMADQLVKLVADWRFAIERAEAFIQPPPMSGPAPIAPAGGHP